MKNQYSTKIMLLGNPPFALMYKKSDRWVALDPLIVRPDPLGVLKKNITYNATAKYKKNKLVSFDIQSKKFFVVM